MLSFSRGRRWTRYRMSNDTIIMIVIFPRRVRRPCVSVKPKRTLARSRSTYNAIIIIIITRKKKIYICIPTYTHGRRQRLIIVDSFAPVGEPENRLVPPNDTHTMLLTRGERKIRPVQPDHTGRTGSVEP